MKGYHIKTVYKDGVTTYDIIDLVPNMTPETVFDLYLMSVENTDNDTLSISMLELGTDTVLAHYNFPVTAAN